MYLDLNGDGRNERELRMAQMRAVLPGPLVDFLLAPDPDWEAPLRGRLSRIPVIPGRMTLITPYGHYKHTPHLPKQARAVRESGPLVDRNGAWEGKGG